MKFYLEITLQLSPPFSPVHVGQSWAREAWNEMSLCSELNHVLSVCKVEKLSENWKTFNKGYGGVAVLLAQFSFCTRRSPKDLYLHFTFKWSHWESVLNYWPVNQTKGTKREFVHCALLELLKLGAKQRYWSLGGHLYCKRQLDSELKIWVPESWKKNKTCVLGTSHHTQLNRLGFFLTTPFHYLL